LVDLAINIKLLSIGLTTFALFSVWLLSFTIVSIYFTISPGTTFFALTHFLLFLPFLSFTNIFWNELVWIFTKLFSFAFAKVKNSVFISTKWVKATKVVPGDVVKYIDTIVNDSNQTLKSAKVVNPIDKSLIFIAKSTNSTAKYELKFSIDGGNTFKEPSNLFVTNKKGKKVLAQAKDYNALEFTVKEVPANSKVKVSFKTKLK